MSDEHPFLHEDITEEELTQLATMISNQDIPAEFNQLITENFSELIDETPQVEEVNEPESNNNQINQTNESPGIDWF